MAAVWFLRVFIFYLILTPVTVLISSLGLICLPLPSNLRYFIVTRWSHFFIWWAKLTCGLNYDIQGMENLPQGPAVVLCNHQSTWETIFMQILLPPQSWVLKQELLLIPFFGWGLACLEPIAINRANALSVKYLLQQGQAKLEQGRWVLIYPEGTRLNPGEFKPFRRTGAALGAHARVPVIPIAHNAGCFWPRGPWPKRPGTIQVRIGQPIDATQQAASLTTQQAETWIQQQRQHLEAAATAS